MAAFEKALYRVQNSKCFNCGRPLALQRKNGALPPSVNREHVTPRALGGAKGYPNLALSHVNCNRIKDDQPPTPDQLARLAVINAALTREEIVSAAAEEIELLHNPRMADRLPGAGRIRGRAMEFLASTLPHLNHDEMIAAFAAGGAYGSAALPTPLTTSQTATAQVSMPASTAPTRTFAPDPLDIPGEVEGPTVARPRLILALVGFAGLAASIAAAAPMLGLLRDLGALKPVWIAPALLAAAIAIPFFGARSQVEGLWFAGAVLLASAILAALGVTALDPQARSAFNAMMTANEVQFRLPGYVSPLALGALTLSALAWLTITIGGLTARAPLNEAS